MRNPDWTRDELILALELYIRSGRKQLDATNAEVVALSKVLNNLGVHDGQVRGEKFRNPNGVAMKLGNFSAIDPARTGSGLQAGNKLERVVWVDYAESHKKLKATADAIRALGSPGLVREPIRGWDEDGDEEEFAEGRLLTRLHIARERNAKIVRKKKAAVLKETGSLQCECCDFDFHAAYGDLGHGFAECHHRIPLSELKENARTKLTDLAVVCANCHRMLHRTANKMSVEQLRSRRSAQKEVGD
jgi:5-methylcytosine-specific restriction protein A